MSRPNPPPAPVTTADLPEFFDENDIAGSFALRSVFRPGHGHSVKSVRVLVIGDSVPLGDEIASLDGYLRCEKWNGLMLDLEDLETFIEVADAGGVSAAARRLGVSKSIISRRLVRLEAELGAQLLARTTRGAALTEAGVTFREHASKVCTELHIA